jgi:sterol desaturase/sphingolipid hydroxylase (fatty acid hydroxylase superfamily)
VDVYHHGPSRDEGAQKEFSHRLARLAHPVALAVIASHLALLGAGWWALQHLIPDTFPLRLLGQHLVLSQLHRRLIDRAVVAGLLVPAVFLLEYVWMGWAQSSVRHLLVRRTPSGRADIACFLASLTPPMALVSAAMSLGIVFLSGIWLRRAVASSTGFGLNIAVLPLAAQTALLFLLYSLFDYWSHRLDHSRAFWPLHRFHHSADDFTVLTAARTHPAVFTAVVGTTLPGVLLGAAPEALADLSVLVMTLRLVIHSRIDSDFGWVGRWVLQSPRGHRLHHALNRLSINLALVPIWDRLFGTWREVAPGPMAIGVPTPYRQGAWIGPDIWRDYCEFWSGLPKAVFARRG